ncbi:MAG: type II toxin-antitoxin system VapC family toxin [Hyphomicrobiales bacterium]
MSEVVLDASAVMAVLRNEAGAAQVRQSLSVSNVSAVNVAEVVAKLIDYGAEPDEAQQAFGILPCNVVPFDIAQAFSAGAMRARARGLGLSLGDRACLALAEAMNLPALTSDRNWKSFNSTIEIRLIR